MKIIQAIIAIICKLFSKNDTIQDGADIADESDIIVTDSTNVVNPKPATKEEINNYVFVLDPGHGKHTDGKKSPYWINNEGKKTRLEEWEFNRNIARRVAAKLDEHGIEYIFTVHPDDEADLRLFDRVKIANEYQTNKEKVFISIHSNAAPSGVGGWQETASGIETWHYYGSKKGRQIATIFQQYLTDVFPNWTDRGLRSKKTGQFYVLRNTEMPAVLTENGFFNNRLQAQELMQESVRKNIAAAHVAAILWIENNF